MEFEIVIAIYFRLLASSLTLFCFPLKIWPAPYDANFARKHGLLTCHHPHHNHHNHNHWLTNVRFPMLVAAGRFTHITMYMFYASPGSSYILHRIPFLAQPQFNKIKTGTPQFLAGELVFAASNGSYGSEWWQWLLIRPLIAATYTAHPSSPPSEWSMRRFWIPRLILLFVWA